MKPTSDVANMTNLLISKTTKSDWLFALGDGGYIHRLGHHRYRILRY